MLKGIGGAGWVAAAAMLFSVSGVGVKACHLSAWQISSGRAFFAALTLWLLVPEARKRKFWSWKLLPAALCIAAAKLTYVWAAKETTAANAILLQSSAPLWVLLLSPAVLGERIRKRDLGALVVCGLGLYLLFGARIENTALSPNVLGGNVVAGISGVCWAGVILSLRRLRGRGAAAASVAGNGLAALVAGCVVFLDPCGWVDGSVSDWSIVVGLGVIQNGFAYVCLVRGLALIPATRASIIQLIEPVLNPLWAGLAYASERPGFVTIIGGLLVLGGSLVPAAITSRIKSSGRAGSPRDT